MTKQDRYQEILRTIEQTHPGKLLLAPAEVAPLIGLKVGTIYNQLSGGCCPIKFRKNAGRPRALIHDVAEFLASE